jgi:hypothetical protein
MIRRSPVGQLVIPFLELLDRNYFSVSPDFAGFDS